MSRTFRWPAFRVFQNCGYACGSKSSLADQLEVSYAALAMTTQARVSRLQKMAAIVLACMVPYNQALDFLAMPENQV